MKIIPIYFTKYPSYTKRSTIWWRRVSRLFKIGRHYSINGSVPPLIIPFWKFGRNKQVDDMSMISFDKNVLESGGQMLIITEKNCAERARWVRCPWRCFSMLGRIGILLILMVGVVKFKGIICFESEVLLVLSLNSNGVSIYWNFTNFNWGRARLIVVKRN